MRYVIRTLDGETMELGVADGRWVEPSGGPVIDLSGSWVVAGLADAHAHLAQDEMVLEAGDTEAIVRRASAVLDAGVFLCFDKGWCDESVLMLLDRPLGERPDLQAAGRMIAGVDGYFPGFARETDADGLESVIAGSIQPGGWIKLVGDWPRRGQGAVPNFDEGVLAKAVAVAHRAGARVAIHTMAPEVASWAVRAGVDSIEHGLFLTDEDVRMLGDRGGAWVPTLLRMEAVIEDVGRDRTGGRLVAAGLDRVKSLLPVAVASGVAVLAGSDLAVPAGQIALEAIRLHEYGLPVAQAVAAVSTAAFSFAGSPRTFRPGEPADLVAFDRHPFEVPTTMLTPTTVVRSGVIRSRRDG